MIDPFFEALMRITACQELDAIDRVQRRYTRALAPAPKRLLVRRRELENALWPVQKPSTDTES